MLFAYGHRDALDMYSCMRRTLPIGAAPACFPTFIKVVANIRIASIVPFEFICPFCRPAMNKANRSWKLEVSKAFHVVVFCFPAMLCCYRYRIFLEEGRIIFKSATTAHITDILALFFLQTKTKTQKQKNARGV